MELFPEFDSVSSDGQIPLATKMRPSGWKTFQGQEHLVGEGKPLRLLIDRGVRFSFILWGPPGSGKTTIARIVANLAKSRFHEVSAVNASVKDIRKIINLARKTQGSKPILFIDEIHRFSKSQQDIVLPFVEDGTIHLIGSTTENPSLEVIPSLRSRCQIFRLEYLDTMCIRSILLRAINDRTNGLDKLDIDEDAFNLIVSHANGDARRALNVLEATSSIAETQKINGKIGRLVIEGIIQKAGVLYEKGGTEHYDHASAFQKSLRGSNPDAAVYWLAKMVAGGEDPKFIVRRLIVTAAEDIGLADPQALVIANAAADALERLGMPEARIPLAQATIYIARAPKCNTAICAIDHALDDIMNKGLSFPVPDHLKDTHYRDAKKYNYGVNYKYPHDYPDNNVEQEYMPKELYGKTYVPKDKKK